MNEIKGGNDGFIVLFDGYVCGCIYIYSSCCACCIETSPPPLPSLSVRPMVAGAFWCGEGTARAVGL